MENQVNSPIPPSTPQGVGDQLRAAREAQGLSLADISAQTRVAERHLISIEENRFAQLAAPTYAVGFSRAYARAVGLDESDIAARVRRQLDAQPHARPAPLPSFEPGDPARVPPSRIAWLAGLCAVVVVGLLVVYWTSFLSPEGALPSLLPSGQQSTARRVASAPAKPVAAPAPASGPVVLTASAPRVWVKVTDGTGSQLFQKELAQGESWTVPPQAQAPQLRTARPDQLQITVAGRAIAPLGDKPEVISGVLLTPAALLARGAPAGLQPAAQNVPAHGSQLPQRNAASPAPRMDDLLQDSAAPRPSPSPAAQDNPLSTTAQ
jgi:transcriptional regulator with XRE-family HTH domain